VRLVSESFAPRRSAVVLFLPLFAVGSSDVIYRPRHLPKESSRESQPSNIKTQTFITLSQTKPYKSPTVVPVRMLRRSDPLIGPAIQRT
jgi:hypothetical protein